MNEINSALERDNKQESLPKWHEIWGLKVRRNGKRMNDSHGEQCEWKLHAMFHKLWIVWIASA